MTDTDIQNKVVEILHETFEIPLEKLNADTRLLEDLDLDSIDAVDLIVKIQSYTKTKINPEDFKMVRTVGDVTKVISDIYKSENQ